jgi:adenylate cyclase
MTAFFSDVQGFSTFAEHLTPAELVSWLNEYLTAMTTILIDEMGTLDKYEGDAIVAFFGAPVEYQDHAERACRVAIRMQIRLQEMRENLESHKGDQIKKFIRQTRARVGLNTGNMLTGNVGSKQRMNYTMMGHAVNLASRLESSAKQYGIFVQITEATKKEVEEKFLVRRIDLILVVGVSDAIQTYELLDFADSKNKNLELLCTNFEKGIDLYIEKRWDEALEFFEKSLEYEKYRLSFDPDQTNPSKIYINRCQNFKKNPPSKEWNGVYVLESK